MMRALQLNPQVGDPRGRRYSTRVVATVRRMHDGGEGWGLAEIQRYLEGQGIPVAYKTLMRWTDEGYAESERAENRRRQRARNARRRRERGLAQSETPILDRIRELHAAHLSTRSIAVVLSIYEGVTLSKHQVEYALKVGIEPQPGRSSVRAEAEAA